jgi:hypothetical protein
MMVATAAVLALAAATASASRLVAPSAGCPGWGRPAIATDPTTIPRNRARHAVRVFAIQLRQGAAATAGARDGGPKPQFLALAPWVVSGSRDRLASVGASLAAGTGPYCYVQTALIADLPFPAVARRPGCIVAGS